MENCTIKSTREQIICKESHRGAWEWEDKFFEGIQNNEFSKLEARNGLKSLILTKKKKIRKENIIVVLNDQHPDKQFIQMKACCWMEVLCSGHNQYCIWPCHAPCCLIKITSRTNISAEGIFKSKQNPHCLVLQQRLKN